MKPASIPILAAISTLPVVVAFFAFAATAVAETDAPITYSIEGTGSGNLNGNTFTNDPVEITLDGDTSNIVNLGGGNFINPSFTSSGATATVSVTDVTGVRTDTLPHTFALTDIPGQSDPNAGFVFSLVGQPIWLVLSSDFASNALGPIGPTSGTSSISPDFMFPTGSGGDFILTSMGTSTFEAIVPLPAALPLFATGLGGLGLLGWRRKRRAKAVA